MDATDISRTDFITRRRVASFIGLTFIISYLFGIPFNMVISPLVKDTNEVTSVLFPRLITVYGPAIAAVVLTLSGAGPCSTKKLLTKLIPQSRYTWWCLTIPRSCHLQSPEFLLHSLVIF
jgi:hypothetical protein